MPLILAVTSAFLLRPKALKLFSPETVAAAVLAA